MFFLLSFAREKKSVSPPPLLFYVFPLVIRSREKNQSPPPPPFFFVFPLFIRSREGEKKSVPSPPPSFFMFFHLSFAREKIISPPPLFFFYVFPLVIRSREGEKKQFPSTPFFFSAFFVCFVVGWLLFLAQRQEEEYWDKKNHWNSSDYLCDLTAASYVVTTYPPPGQSPRSFQVIKSQVTVSACVIGHFTWEQT